jgi:hypothetical protein
MMHAHALRFPLCTRARARARARARCALICAPHLRARAASRLLALLTWHARRWAYRPHAVEALPDARGAEGNDDDGATLFGSPNATRLPAVRPGWQWIQGAPAPPPPPPPPPPP